MRVIHIVTSLPRENWPRNTFIKSQIESLRDRGIHVDVFEINREPNIWNYFFGPFRFRKMLRKESYDLIHAHYLYPGILAVTQRKLPVVISYMGSEILGTPNDKGRVKIIGVFNIILSNVIQYMVDVIIVKSRNLFVKIKSKKPTYILPNGVDFNMFFPQDRQSCREQLGLATEAKIILFLGRPNDPRKNISLSTAAVEIYKKSTKDTENISFLAPNPTKPELIPIYMNAANVLIQTSLWEGSPNVIKEAMACNISIVSTKVGDVEDIIGTTEGCYLTSFNPKEIANKISTAIEYNRLTAGRKNIKHLRIENIAEKLEGIYLQALS